MNIPEHLQQNAEQARWAGIALLILGSLALLAPLVAGLSIALLTGALLAASGVAQIALAFRSGAASGRVGTLLLGMLSLATGIYMLSQPGAALATLTLLLAIYFTVVGITEVGVAFRARPSSGWGWMAASGAVSVLLGVMIWQQFPLSGVWAVGALIGIRMISAGWLMLAIGSAGKRVAEQVG